MGGVDLVLFDIDGTLLNSGGRGRAAGVDHVCDLVNGLIPRGVDAHRVGERQPEDDL